MEKGLFFSFDTKKKSANFVKILNMKIDFNKFDQLTLGDAEFAVELLAMYKEQFLEYIKNLENLKKIDIDYVRMLNHKVKSSVVLLDAKQLLQKQKQLDHLPQENTSLIGEIIADCHQVIEQIADYSKKFDS